MKNLEFKNKKVAILGMGMEGLALVDFLSDKECEITVLDKLSEEDILKRLSDEEKAKFDQIIKNDQISKIFGDNYLDNLKSFDIIFRSPGISLYNSKIQEARENGTLISSQIKLFFDLCPCKIIGVTGTKGKGTTATLIYEIMSQNNQETRNNNQITASGGIPSGCGTNLKSQNSNDQPTTRPTNYPTNVYLAGNIGYPAITLIPSLKSDDTVILELSSFQLMDLEKSPHIAVVTNLSVDHLDYHKNTEEYRGAKESIIKYQNEDDFAVLNSKSTFDPTILALVKSSIKYFSNPDRDDAVVLNNSVILDPKNRNFKICDKDSIELFGHHNLENIAAATLVADILNVDVDTIKEVVQEFKGLPHRIEFVAEINGVKFVNDSFATNPEPTMAAINSFSDDKILILGGSSKGAEFSELAQKIADSNIKAVVLIGDEADKIERALNLASYPGQIKKDFSNIDEIVEAALRLASEGDVVILSPACASFGLFKNYKDRGDKFRMAVLNLK